MLEITTAQAFRCTDMRTNTPIGVWRTEPMPDRERVRHIIDMPQWFRVERMSDMEWHGHLQKRQIAKVKVKDPERIPR